MRSSHPPVRRDRVRGEGIAAVASARTAEAIVPAIEPDDRYPGIVRREAADVAASRCRQRDSATAGSKTIKAIVRDEGGLPSHFVAAEWLRKVSARAAARRAEVQRTISAIKSSDRVKVELREIHPLLRKWLMRSRSALRSRSASYARSRLAWSRIRCSTIAASSSSSSGRLRNSGSY